MQPNGITYALYDGGISQGTDVCMRFCEQIFESLFKSFSPNGAPTTLLVKMGMVILNPYLMKNCANDFLRVGASVNMRTRYDFDYLFIPSFVKSQAQILEKLLLIAKKMQKSTS